ncbi:MAG: hypothetical protein ABFC96_07605 [Thermoguttaceae bacterium]
MATIALHFPLGEVTLAQRLRAMLATCDTTADFSIWSGDYLAHANLIPEGEAHALVRDAVGVQRRIGRAA